MSRSLNIIHPILSTTKVWNTSGSCTATLTGHQGSIRCLHNWTCGSNEAIISGGDDGVVRVWRSHSVRKRGSTARRKLRWTSVILVGHNDAVSCLGLLDGLGVLVSGSLDCSIRFWDLRAVDATTATSTGRRQSAQATLSPCACHEQQDAVECLCVLPASDSDPSQQRVVTASQSVVMWRVRCTRV